MGETRRAGALAACPRNSRGSDRNSASLRRGRCSRRQARAAPAAGFPRRANPSPYCARRNSMRKAGAVSRRAANFSRDPASMKTSPVRWNSRPKLRETNPSSRNFLRGGLRSGGRGFRRPVLIRVGEVIIARELQQRKTILRERRWFAPRLRDHARVIEHRVPCQVGKKHFEQRGELARLPEAPGEEIHHA